MQTPLKGMWSLRPCPQCKAPPGEPTIWGEYHIFSCWHSAAIDRNNVVLRAVGLKEATKDWNELMRS